FASTSRLNTLETIGRTVIGGRFDYNAYNQVGSTRLHFGGGNSDANGNYYIGTNLNNYGGNYTKLDLRWHTGIRMGAQPGYGGIRFYDTEDLGTEIFAIGKSSNFAQAAYSVRAPVFYDSNDTGYYTDPNSFTRLNRLQINARNDNYYVGTVNSTNNQSNWQNLTNVNGQFTVTQYNAIQNYSNSPGSSVYTYGSVISTRTANHSFQLYSAHTGDLAYKTQWNNDNYSGWLTPVVYGRNSGSTSGHTIYGSTYYDRDSTGYYTNPASTSNMNTIQITGGGTLRFMDYGLGVTGTYTSTRLQTIFNMDDQYSISDNGAATNNAYGLYWSHQNAGGLGGANNLNDHGLLIINNGTFRAAISSRAVFSNEVRGTLFRDYNDTGYYVDPASTSRLKNLRIEAGHGDTRLQLFYNQGNPIYDSHLTLWASEPGITYDNSGIGGNVNFSGQYYGRQSNSNPYAAYVRFDVNGGQVEAWTSTGSTGSAGGQGTRQWWVNQAGDSQSRVSSRAPIFYDSNNTGYYLNPASTSILNDVRVDIMYDKDNTSYYARPGSTSIFNDLRANIFYSRSNTGYYSDPESTSNFNVLRAQTFRNDGSVSSDDGFGLYWD
ncbi:MAG: hypothetical protein ACKVJK_17855, partial [Methylophagaceae bacterium]